MEPDKDYKDKDRTIDITADLTDQSTQGITKVYTQWKTGGDANQDDNKITPQDNLLDNPFKDNQLYKL